MLKEKGRQNREGMKKKILLKEIQAKPQISEVWK